MQGGWDSVIHTKQRIFGYKLHIVSSMGSLIVVPLATDFTQANIYDNQIYPAIISSLPHGVRYVEAADSGYDDDCNLYNLSITRGFEIIVSLISEI